MMTELAPQDKAGSYTRPSYDSNGVLGKNEFPDVGGGRYHVYVGNPCPWCHRVRLAVALRRFTSDQIGMTTLVDDPIKASRGGWVFDSTNDKDPLGCSDLVSMIQQQQLLYKNSSGSQIMFSICNRENCMKYYRQTMREGVQLRYLWI